METASEITQYVNLVLFTGLALLCVDMARKSRTVPARWAAVSFGVLGAIIVLGQLLPDDGEDIPQLAVKVLLVALLAYPYALYRFSASFEAVSRRIDSAAYIFTGLVAVASLALPHVPQEDEVRPAWFQVYLAAFILDWVALGLVAAGRLWRAGTGMANVSRYRMRTLGLGAIGLALALLPGFVPEAEQPVGLRVVSLALPSLSALMFVLGLAPPGWLRMIWRRNDQVALRRLEFELVAADDREQVLAGVLPHAAALVGGRSARFTTDPPPESESGPQRVTIPVADGYLVVDMSPYAPFFGSDELEMLRSLAAYLGLVLERAALLDREREARAVAERTSAELETLVYGISHDLKSPVISLLGYLEYLREDHGESLNDEARHYLDRMEKSAVYMQDLLGDLLELSRIGRSSVEAEDVDLVELVEDVRLDMVQKFQSIAVEIADLPVLIVNPARARQLFTNLIENAARHAGRPDVTIRVFGAVRDDGSAVVSVADDGIGIPEEYREKAFGIFERLSPRDASAGTGIGLALCRKIVENIGGDISIIDSTSGTHVRIELPRGVVRGERRPTYEVAR